MPLMFMEPENERPRVTAAEQNSDEVATRPGLAVAVTQKLYAELQAYIEGVETNFPRSDLVHVAQGSLEEIQVHIQQFNLQTEVLRLQAEPAYVALLRDAEQPDLVLPTPVVGPDVRAGREFVEQYQAFAGELADTGLQIETYEPRSTIEVFTDRLAEHLAVRSPPVAPGQFGNADTVVTTRRDGDPVVQCLGYFVSTAITVGTSKSVVVPKLSGRYSFGISLQGRHVFDGNVWNCPRHDVTVDLP